MYQIYSRYYLHKKTRGIYNVLFNITNNLHCDNMFSKCLPQLPDSAKFCPNNISQYMKKFLQHLLQTKCYMKPSIIPVLLSFTSKYIFVSLKSRRVSYITNSPLMIDPIYISNLLLLLVVYVSNGCWYACKARYLLPVKCSAGTGVASTGTS